MKTDCQGLLQRFGSEGMMALSRLVGGQVGRTGKVLYMFLGQSQ